MNCAWQQVPATDRRAADPREGGGLFIRAAPPKAPIGPSSQVR